MNGLKFISEPRTNLCRQTSVMYPCLPFGDLKLYLPFDYLLSFISYPQEKKVEPNTFFSISWISSPVFIFILHIQAIRDFPAFYMPSFEEVVRYLSPLLSPSSPSFQITPLETSALLLSDSLGGSGISIPLPSHTENNYEAKKFS